MFGNHAANRMMRDSLVNRNIWIHAEVEFRDTGCCQQAVVFLLGSICPSGGEFQRQRHCGCWVLIPEEPFKRASRATQFQMICWQGCFIAP